MTGIRESCGCGAKIRVDHPDLAVTAARIVTDWRGTHRCPQSDRDITGGAHLESTAPPFSSDTIPTGRTRADGRLGLLPATDPIDYRAIDAARQDWEARR